MDRNLTTDYVALKFSFASYLLVSNFTKSFLNRPSVTHFVLRAKANFQAVPNPNVNHNKHLNPSAVGSVSGTQAMLIGHRPWKLDRCTCFRELMTRRPVDGRRNVFRHVQIACAGGLGAG